MSLEAGAWRGQSELMSGLWAGPGAGTVRGRDYLSVCLGGSGTCLMSSHSDYPHNDPKWMYSALHLSPLTHHAGDVPVVTPEELAQS